MQTEKHLIFIGGYLSLSLISHIQLALKLVHNLLDEVCDNFILKEGHLMGHLMTGGMVL